MSQSSSGPHAEYLIWSQQSEFSSKQGLKHAGRMWPVRALCAARDAFWEWSNNEHLHCQVPWKKVPRNNWIKAEWYPVRFSSRPSITDQISLSRKFLKNLGNMPKTPTHALSDSRKHTNGFLVKRFVEWCVSTVLTAACCWPIKFVSVSEAVLPLCYEEKPHNLP